jgi:hypothetical protein
VPIRRVVLIEGIFDSQEDSFDFYGGTMVFWFENYCRSCLENNITDKSSIYDKCYVSISKKASKQRGFESKPGDSIRITAWNNIFGKTLSYKIEETDFAEKFGPLQLQREDDEQVAYREASDRRHALERGLTVEEYRHVIEEEAIRNAMESLDMSREEVLAQNIHELPKFILATGRLLCKKLGRNVTLEEICEAHREDNRKMESLLHRPWTEEDERMHEGIIASIKEIEAKEEAEHNTLPGPNCLLQGHLHTIHTTGQIPHPYLEHLKTCKRCTYQAEQHKQAWLNKVAPMPELPRLRLPSLRKKQKTK